MRTERKQSSPRQSAIRPPSKGDADGIKRAQAFLKRYGYLQDAFAPGVMDEITARAVHAYQKFTHLPPSGVLDEKTIEKMSRPRCGMPDVHDHRLFVLLAAWNKMDLTFAFDNDTADIPGADERQAVRYAFQTWAAVAPLTFREVSVREPHDIRISWRPALCGDRDMRNGAIAHSDYPPPSAPAGQTPLPLPLHFNDEECTFAIGAVPDAYDVQTVALHEIGHLLGLYHSTSYPTVMEAMSGFTNYIYRELQPDDIAAIQSLYTRITRLGDSGNLAGSVSAIASTEHGTQHVLTAVRDGSNRLLLISWLVNDDGSVTRSGDSGNQAGELSQEGVVEGAEGIVDIASGSRYVVACATSAGKLKLISWDIDAAGAIARAGDSADQAGTARLIKIVALSDSLFVTACQNGSGNLILISWRLSPDGSLSRLHDSGNAAGQVSEISLLDVSEGSAGDRVATVVRNGSGNLHIIVWSVGVDGTIVRMGQAISGEATRIRAIRDTFGHLITACRAGTGTLLLRAWTIMPAGDPVRQFDNNPWGTSQVGEIRDVAVMSRPNGRILTAVRNASDDLQVIQWVIHQSDLGWQMNRSRSADQPVGVASLINLCQGALGGSVPFVTAVRTGSGTLKLISWRD